MKEIVKSLINKGVLVNPELLREHDKLMDLYNKVFNDNNQSQHKISAPLSPEIEIIKNYSVDYEKKDISTFFNHYLSRFEKIKNILINRPKLINVTSISKVKYRNDQGNVSIIGMIKDKRETINKNIILTVDDPTGEINIHINSLKKELYTSAKSLVLDEIIGIVGVMKGDIIFAEDIIIPDIPMDIETKKISEESYVLFLSDIHVGSVNFLEEEFNRFLSWLNGEIGDSKQKEIVNKIQYIFIAGDLVDGVGIYPGQVEELAIPDIKEQYKKLVEYLIRIPKNIKVIICPGNHDAVRLAEPQPAFDIDIASPLFNIPNIELVSNPSYVRIAKTDNFEGFDVLMYHGYSFDYFISNIDMIRNNGGYDRADLVMKFLLQKRHLSPTHGSTVFIPFNKEDPLVIDRVPDFMVTGHIHKTSVANYRKVTMICGSCWQKKTAFQEKLGHNPEPARVPIVNLNTREIKILKFNTN